MEYTVATSASIWKQLTGHLLGSGEERMAFGYGSVAGDREKARIALRELAVPADSEYAERGPSRVILSAAAAVPYLMRAKGSGAFLDAHSHPRGCGVSPSQTDQQAASRQLRSLHGPAPDALLVRTIHSPDGDIWACVHTASGRVVPVSRILVHGKDGLSVLTPVNKAQQTAAPLKVDRRTAACLGEARIQGLRALSVGIVGIGGVGSMVARLLGGLAGKLVLVDGDRLEAHNAPRVWFAGARSQGLKVERARRALRRDFPHLQVKAMNEFFPSQASVQELAAVDLLFVCPDHNAVRYSASRFAAEHLIPLIEVGCGGRAGGGAITALGHHIRLQLPRPECPCLCCNGLDLSKLEDPETTRWKKRVRYVEGDGELEGELAPLTTRAAADAVDVFLRYCAGFPGRPPRHLYFDALNMKTVDLTGSYTARRWCPRCGDDRGRAPLMSGACEPAMLSAEDRGPE